ncbi:hypothetical protein GGX14DRAFT_596143 [Mycena pura]|uniref:Uncharacterized protein n=1 Tax=Mycena pura TaxID=153505 RepID=A0AAD6UPQ9_9AGAR|nr:hypothetical protein GGX14DRAFT_596143 [Mycena pura]
MDRLRRGEGVVLGGRHRRHRASVARRIADDSSEDTGVHRAAVQDDSDLETCEIGQLRVLVTTGQFCQWHGSLHAEVRDGEKREKAEKHRETTGTALRVWLHHDAQSSELWAHSPASFSANGSSQPPCSVRLSTTDQPASSACLKALLARDVWSKYREADFQRKKRALLVFFVLRRRYFHLLLLHPSARETRDTGTRMPSSHSTRSASPNTPTPTTRWRERARRDPLQQRLRQFLADEERFWRALVLRVQRSYDIRLPPTVTLPPELVGEEETKDRMNHFRFPPVTDPPVFGVWRSQSQQSARLSRRHCALPRAALKLPAHIPEPKKRLDEHRPNYLRALCFAAHALAPHEGNASHQLAILAGTKVTRSRPSHGTSMRAPFDTAGENLAGVLTKALTHPQARAAVEAAVSTVVVEGGHEREECEPLPLPPVKCCLSPHTLRDSSRGYCPLGVGVLAQAAVWLGRMRPVLPAVAPASSVADAGDAEDAKEKDTKVKERDRARRRTKHKLAPIPAAAEPKPRLRDALRCSRIPHISRICSRTALLVVGVRELKEVDMYAQPRAPAPAPASALPAPGKGRRARPELAERISAEFRRTLPALRVGSKWVIANGAWVCAATDGGGVTNDAARAKENGGGKMEAEKEHNEEELELRAQLFSCRITPSAFAACRTSRLPIWRSGSRGARRRDVAVPRETVEVELELEEDINMRGWLPLSGPTGGPCPLPSYDDDATKEMANASGTLERRTVGLKKKRRCTRSSCVSAICCAMGGGLSSLRSLAAGAIWGQCVVKGVEAAKPVAPAPASKDSNNESHTIKTTRHIHAPSGAHATSRLVSKMKNKTTTSFLKAFQASPTKCKTQVVKNPGIQVEELSSLQIPAEKAGGKIPVPGHAGGHLFDVYMGPSSLQADVNSSFFNPVNTPVASEDAHFEAIPPLPPAITTTFHPESLHAAPPLSPPITNRGSKRTSFADLSEVSPVTMATGGPRH